VAPFGLFPAGAVSSLVTCWCVRNKPSYYCVRRLEPKELANRWDVPLLVQEYATGLNLLPLLTAFLGTVPGKTLLLGSDFLVAYFLRGWWCSATEHVDNTRPAPFQLYPSPGPPDPMLEAGMMAPEAVLDEGAIAA